MALPLITDGAKRLAGRGLHFASTWLPLFTGSCFALSALFNAAVFQLTYGLSYFALATPSDVVMSAFFVFAILCLFALLYWLWLWGIFSITSRLFPRLSARRVRDLNILACYLVAIWFLIRFYLAFASPSFDPMVSERQLTTASGLYDKCGPAFVIWSGSDRTVLNCKGQIWVVPSDGLIWSPARRSTRDRPPETPKKANPKQSAAPLQKS